MKRARMVYGVMVAVLAISLMIPTALLAAQGGKNATDTIQGTVEKGDKGITVIHTDDGQTVTVLGKNMADMVGKSVKVTGTLTKGGKTRSIVVMSVEEIKE